VGKEGREGRVSTHGHTVAVDVPQVVVKRKRRRREGGRERRRHHPPPRSVHQTAPVYACKKT